MKLVGREADSFLGRAFSFNDDYSLVGILRAIIIEHTEWDLESITNGSKANLFRASSDRDAGRVFDDPSLYAISVCEARNGYFPETLTKTGWKCLDEAPYPINKYLSQFAKTKVFVNEESKRVVAFVERIATDRWIRAFISTFARMLTWYFPEKLSEEDQRFFKAISVGNKEVTEEQAADAIVEYINNAAKKLNFRELSLHKQLDGFENTIRNTQIEEYQRVISDTARNISRHQEELSRLYSVMCENTVLLSALENSPVSESTELFDFFNNHKCLSVISVEEDDIRFGVTETLEYYDQDAFSRICGRQGSWLYEFNEDIVKVMKAIFADEKGMFLTNAVFSLRAMRYISMKNELSETEALPHPHIYFYNCSGGNDQYYSRYAESGEWQLAIEQAIGATKNINFGDSTVCRRMCEWLNANRDVRCIKTASSDRLVSVKEFLKILNEGE